jgi:hypothetical protein
MEAISRPDLRALSVDSLQTEPSSALWVDSEIAASGERYSRDQRVSIAAA